MDIYNLGKVDSITDDESMLRFGFSIIGVIGRPIVSFEFDTQEEAEAAHKAMQAIVAKAKLITILRRPLTPFRSPTRSATRSRRRTGEAICCTSGISSGETGVQDRDSSFSRSFPLYLRRPRLLGRGLFSSRISRTASAKSTSAAKKKPQPERRPGLKLG